MKVKRNRIGETNINRYGSYMIIEKYNREDDIWVRFIKTNNLVHTSYTKFKNGILKNPYDRSVYGVGYMGEGKYVSSLNYKKCNQYTAWVNMLERCYSEKYHERQPTYKDCVVAEEWHNYQDFAKWFDENYYEIDGEIMCLDKDILIKGNKVYSPDTCVFVPKFINNLFVKSDALRGELPLGVTWHKANKYYISQCTYNGDRVSLGSFNTQEEAFESYKSYKEDLIKSIANKYIEKIPKKLHEAMINYTVEISD